MYKVKLILLLVVVNFISISLFSQTVGYVYTRVPEKYLSRLNKNKAVFNTDLNGVDVRSFLPKNYKKDGSVDYTSYIQSAIDKNNTVIFPNFPLKIGVGGLSLRSNNTLIFEDGGGLIMTPNGNANYSVVNLDRVNNVKIYNINIIGERDKHFNQSGQWGMGISIKGSNDILIQNATISKCWGDGIYIGGSINGKTNENIRVINSLLDNNRRNGISIISGININIQNCIISNTVGQNPMAGIDIEPNNNNDIIKSIQLTDIVTYNNRWYGIIVALSHLVGQKETNAQVFIDNHLDDSSTIAFATSLGARKKGNFSSIKGNVNVNNPIWMNNRKTSYFYFDTFNNDMKVNFKNVKIMGDKYNSSQKKRQADFDSTVKAKSDLRVSF